MIESLGRDTFSERALALVDSDGKPISVPADTWTQLLVYRKDLFEKEGLETPDTFEKIQAAGDAIRSHGMRFNAGHALNYFNVQPVARLPGVRELHIGHAIVSRAVFVGMREAVREMKTLMRQAAR